MTDDREDPAFEALLGELARAPDAELILPAGAKVGRFEIAGVLGRGGMGVVYRAHDPRLERAVALKVARGARAADAERLVAEARTLGRLAHPNVVTVHDVDRLDDDGRVSIAMELVDGGTLRDWIGAAPRSTAEVQDALRQAGLGLLAAHRAGLVHCDFKPENVLVGADGRARVSDFGIARVLAEAPPGAEPGAAGASARGGTLAYMAPEQLRGARIDARADQYAFALVARELLEGAPAFAGGPEARLDAMRAGAPPWRRTEATARTRAALDRALEYDPADRHASLEPLLEALAPPPGRSAAKVAIAAAGGALALVAVGYAGVRAGVDPCAAPASSLTAAWRAELAPALPQGATRARLAALVETWEAVRRRTCEARGASLSEPVYLSRQLCLHDLGVQIASVAEITAATPEAPAGATRLLSPALCEREGFSETRVPPPPDAIAARVAEVRRAVAEARALEDAARFADGLARARAAVTAASEIGYAPLSAEARYTLGRLERAQDRLREAADTMEKAYLQARAAPYDRLAAEIAGELAYLHGFHLSRVDAGKRWADLALADVARLRGAGPIEARVLMNTGTAFGWAGERDEGIRQHRRALALVLEHRPADHPEVALARARLGSSLARTDARAEGIEQLQAAVRSLEATYGPDHPALVRPLTKLGLTLTDRASVEASLERLERALSIARRTYGEAHSATGLAWLNLGAGRYTAGRLAEAAPAYERAVEVLTAALGDDHPDLALVSTNLGLVYADRGDHARALARQRDALASAEAAFGEDNPALLPYIINLTSALVELERWREALRVVDRGERLGQGPPYGAFFEQYRGQALLALGRFEAGLAAYERSLAARPQDGTPPRYRAESLFGVARALDRLRRDPARARALADEAAGLLEGDDGAAQLAARVASWRRARR